LAASFTIEGTTPKRVLIRALGSTLKAVGASNAMSDPFLTLTDNTGGYVAHNDNWGDAANAADIVNVGLQLGAVAFSTGSKDAAILITLVPGSYTATVAPADGAAGTVLVEVYEADTVLRLAGVALRGKAAAGAPLGYGIVVVGGVARPYLIRGLGPVLGSPTALIDPAVGIYRSGQLLTGNDDWSTDAAEATRLGDAASRLGLVPLSSGSKDAAMLVSLEPGTYVAQLTTAATTAGDAVLEIVEADPFRSTALVPSFVLQPDSQEAAAGATVKLTSLAGGAPLPAYQWKKDDVNVTGATNATLTLTNLQAADAGTYTSSPRM
jgi:hypothetical protein